MKISMTLALGAALLAAAPGLAYASGNRGGTNTNPNSASTFAPGHTGRPSPGQIQNAPGSSTTAREAAPGQVKRQDDPPKTTSTTKRLNNQ